MSSEMTMFLESVGMTVLVIFGIWCAFNEDKLITWEKRHGIDFAEDLCAIGRWFKSLAWAVLCGLSLVGSAVVKKIKSERNKRTRLVYVVPKHGLTVGTYRRIRS